MKKIYKWVKRGIAELLFASVLDEDFWMGIHHGRISGLRADILFLENLAKGENKTNAKGMQVAIDALKKLDAVNERTYAPVVKDPRA